MVMIENTPLSVLAQLVRFAPNEVQDEELPPREEEENLKHGHNHLHHHHLMSFSQILA